MSKQTLTSVLLALWAAACLASLWYLFFVGPTGDGFTRGLNRVAGFVGWQLAAAVLALMTWWAGRDLTRGSLLRWLSLIPGFAALAVTAGMCVLVLWAWAAIPSRAPDAPGPVTAPVDAKPQD